MLHERPEVKTDEMTGNEGCFFEHSSVMPAVGEVNLGQDGLLERFEFTEGDAKLMNLVGAPTSLGLYLRGLEKVSQFPKKIRKLGRDLLSALGEGETGPS